MTVDNNKTGLGEGEVQYLIDMAKAISEGDFYREFNTHVGGELAQLAQYIDKTRKSLQNIHPSLNETSERIPNASEQLKSITIDTEKATNSIMDLTEDLLDSTDESETLLEELKKHIMEKSEDQESALALISRLDEKNSTRRTNLMQIFENLSFQDLTGQKINKIITLVQEVETRILKILLTFNLVKKPAPQQEEEPDINQDTSDEIMEKFQQLSQGNEKTDLSQDFIDDILNSL